MRHRKKFNHLGRKTAHRKAMLSNMAISLITHKRISTTVAKAKALRIYVEPILNRAKTDSTHSRRMVFRKLQDKDAVTELFRDIAVKIADRPGGYTRILKTGSRLGDNAEMCIMELVDYNESYKLEGKTKTKKKRTRRGSGTTTDKVETKEVEAVEKVVEDAVEKTDEAKDENTDDKN